MNKTKPKYLVWFPLAPKRYKKFNSLKRARIFCDKQKSEAAINIFPFTTDEDTVYSNKKGYSNY